MVRETRYLWVGNLPDKITEERIYEHFQRYGKIQSVRLHKKEGESGSATIAFMDIKSASKAHSADNTIESIKVLTQYSDSTATGTSVTRTDPLEATRGLYNTAQIRQGRFPASSRPEGLTEERAYPRQEYYSGREQSYDRRQQGYEEFNRTQTKQKFDATAKPQRFREHSQTRNVTTPRAYEHQAEPRERIDWARAPPSPARSTSSQWSRKRSPSPTPRSRSSSVSSNGSTGSSRSRSRSSKSVRDERKTSITLESSRLMSQTSVDSLDKGDDKKNLGICVRGMPVRSSDTSLRDGLFHEYKKHGKVTSVHVFGQGEERYAIVSFKKPEDASKALEASQGKMFFGTKIEVAEHEGFEAEDEFRPPEAELDEYHPKATRTLFVGNLEKDISKDELREIFRSYGEIIDIDIKKQGAVSAYGFVQYSDICSVVKALRKMDGEHIGANKIKLGFGKSMPTNCVWLDNVAETVTERFLMRQFSRYGGASHSVIDRSLGRALIYYDNMEFAQYAVSEMRGRALGGKKLQIDFASRECQNRFFERMERTGQLRPGERPDERAGGRWSRTSGEFFDENSSSSSRDFNSFTTGGRGRQGFNQFERGRGPFQRGSNRRNFRGRGQGRGRGFYEGFSDDYRQRSLDDFPADENLAEDSYEQELREYYQQRERIDQRSPGDSERSQDRLGSPFSHKRADSPEFERPRGMEEYYSEKFKDTDSQSGDRESVRSYRSSRSDTRRDTSEKHYEEKYEREPYFEDYAHEKRAQSPTTSDYSQQSRSPRHRSRSVTPIPKDHRGRGSRTQSPDAFMDFPRQESPTPMDYDVLHEYTKGRDKKQEKRHSQEESESSTGARIKSKRSSRASDMDSDTEKLRKSQKPRAYMSDDEASDPEPMIKSEVSDRFVKRHSLETLPKPKVISTEEYFKRKMDKFPRSSVTSTVTKVKRKETSVDVRTDVKESRVEKLERTYRPEKTVEKHESNVPKSYVKKVTKVLPGPLEGQQPGVTTQSPGSSSSSGSCKLDSDQDSVADRESVRSQASLEIKRQQLLDQLQELEDSGSMSDNDSGSIDDERKRKPRLEDVFDLEHFEHDKRKDVLKTDVENPSVSEKLKDSGVIDPKASGVHRFKPIDSTQSYRKQMEAHRKMEEKRTKGEIKPGKSERSKLVHQSNYLDEEDPLGSDQDNKSPKEIPAEFISRKRKKSDVAEEPFPKARRTYRIKNKSEEIFSPSSGEDSDHEPKGAKTKLSVSVPPKPIGMVEPMTVSMVTPQKNDGGQVMVTPIGKHSFPEIVKPGMPGPSPVGPPSPKPVPPPDYTMDKLDSMADSDKNVSRYNVIGDTRHVLVNSDHTLETPKRTAGRPPLDSRLGSVVLKPDKQSDIDSPTERTKSVPETKQDIWKPRETSHSPVEKFSVPEPRTIPTDTKREGPMSLPLPRFARQSSFGVSPKVSPKASPKHQPSPKVSSPQVSCSISKLQSPPFSPGQSSHSSPVWTKPDPPPPPPPPLESKDPAEPAAPDLLEEQTEKTPVSVQEPVQPPTLVSTTDTAEKVEPTPKESTASIQKAAATDAIDTEKKPAVKEEESDSELSSPLHSPTSVSLDERIRALDEKLSLTSAMKTERPPPPPPSFDYRDKYRVVKKRAAPAVNLTSSSSSTTNPGMESRAEPSDIVHKILSRSSIFDQDFKRLEKIDEKYEPKGINLERSRSPGRSGPVRTKGCPKEIPNMSQIEPLDFAQHRQIPASASPYSTRPDPLGTSLPGRPPLLTSTSFTQQSTSMRTPGTTSLGKSASFDFVRSSCSSSPRQSSTQHNKEGWPPLVLDDSSGPKWIEPAGANTPRVSQGMSPRSTASMSPASDHMPVLSAIKRDPVPEYNSSKDVTSVISSKQDPGRSGNGKKTSSPEDVKPAVTDVKTTPLLKKTSSESGKSESQKSSEPENKRVKLSSGNASKEKSLDGSRSSHKESKKSKQSSVAKSPDKRLFVPDTPKSTDKKREDKQPEQKTTEKQISVEKVNETTAEKKKESPQEKTKESHQEKNKESHPEKLKESVKEKDTSSEKEKPKDRDSGKTTAEKERSKERDSSKSNVDKDKQKESSKNKDHKEKRDGKEHSKSKHHKDKKERVKVEAESCSSDKKSDDGRPEKRDDKDRQRHKHPEHKHSDMKKHSQKEKPTDTSAETSKSKSKEENHESKSKSKDESSDNKTKCKETVSSESKTKVKEDNKSAHKEKSKEKNEKSDKNHKQASSSSSTSSDKHKPPERGDSKDKGDSRDKGSRESTSSKKAPKQDKHREHKDEGSKSSSKQQSKESKDKDNKEKTQTSSEKHRQKVTDKQDKKSDKREKKPPKPKEPEFNALNIEEDPFAPYLSMYDKIKRRSNKEQPKEEKTEKVKETLAQLQEMRKKKIGCSDDSNGMCPEDDEPIVKEIKQEPKKHPKKEPEKSKDLKTKRRWIIDSSSSDEDSSKSDNSEAFNELTRRPAKAKKDWSKIWSCSSSTSSEEEHSTPKSKKKSKSYSIESSDSEPLPPVKKMEPKSKKAKEKPKEKKPEKKKPETKEDGKLSSESSKFVKKSLSETSVKQVKSSQKEKISKKTKEISKDREKINDSPKETPQKTSKDPLSKQSSSQKQQQEKKAETKEPVKETNKKQEVKDTVKEQTEKPGVEKKERNKSVERKNKDKKKDKSEHTGDTGKKSDPMQDGLSKIDYKPEKSSRDNKHKQSDKPSKTDVSTKDKSNTDKADSVKREETQEHKPVHNDLSPISEKGTEKCTNNERDVINTILPNLNEIKKEEVEPGNLEKEKEKSFVRKTERPLQKERAVFFDSEDESMPLAAFSEEKNKKDTESNIFSNLPSLESSVEKDVQPAKPVGSPWGAPILMQLETELEDSIRAAKKQKENRASKAKMFKPKESIKSSEPEPVLSKLGGKAFDEQPDEVVKVPAKERESPETVENTNVVMPDKVSDVPEPEPNYATATKSGKQPEAEPEEVTVKSEKQPEQDTFSDLDIDKHSKPISLEIPGETKKEEKTEMKVSPVVVTQEQLDQATQSITMLSEPVKPKTENTPVEVIQAPDKPEEEEKEPQEQSQEQQEESRLAADRLMEMMGFPMPEPVQAEVNPLEESLFWPVGEQTDSETADAVQALEGKIPERNESIDISEETAKKDVSGPPDLPPTDLPLSPKPTENVSAAEVPRSVELPQKPDEKKTPRNSVDDTIASVVAASTAEANYTNTVVSEAVSHKEPEIEIETPKAKGKRAKKPKTKKKAEDENKLVHGETLLNTDQAHSVDHTAAESQENRVPSPGLLMVQPVSVKLRPTKHSPQPAAVQESKFPADFPIIKESPLVYHAERHSPRDPHGSKLSPSNLLSTSSFSAAEAYKFPPDDDPSDDLPHTVPLYNALSVKQTLGTSPFRMKESPTADLGGDLSDDPTTLVIDTDVVPEEKVDNEKPVLQEQDEKPKQDLTIKDQSTAIVQSQAEVDSLSVSNRKYSEDSLESSDVKPAGDTPELHEQKVDTRPRRGKRNRRLTARSEADDQHQPDEEKTQSEHNPPETEKSPPSITSRMRSRSSEQTAKKTAEVKEGTDGPERVSSRGRKIIPKEPKEIFDEVPGISRKSRRGSAQKEPETEPPRGRSRRLAGTQPPETDQEPRTPRRNRRTSTRISKEDEIQGDVKESNFDMQDDAEEKEELEESPTKIRRNLRRRTQRRIVAREPEEDKQEDLVTIDPDVSGSLLRPDDSSTDTTSAADTSTDTFDNLNTPKKRGRGRPKGSTNKKQQDTPFGKGKTSDGANSPRARGLEMGSTSPKGGDISAPFVKLEKLPLGTWRRDEGLSLDAKKDKFDDQRSGEKPKKDLYEWEDEEETPVTELFTPKRSRKRKNFEQNSGTIPPLKVNLSDKSVEEVTEVAAPEPKKVKQDEVEEKVEELKPAIPEVSTAVNVEPVKPAAAVDLKPGIERKSGTESSMMTMHLPAKLAYKQEIHEAQRQQQQLQLKLQLQKQAENSTIPTISNPLSDTNPAVTAMSVGTGDSLSNIDRIIEAVASGNFEREDDFDYYLKKRQVRSRTWSEERATILTSATSSAPTTPSVVSSTPPVSSHVSSAGLSWSQAHHVTSQTVATTSSPAVSAGVISVAGQPLAASRQPVVPSVSSDDTRKTMIPSPPRNVSHQLDNERPLQEPMKTMTSHSGPPTVQQALVPPGSSPRMPGAPQVVTHPTTASHAFSPGMQPSPTIKSPAVQTSSPLLQQQQAAAVPVSSQPNPILALQKAGYPVTPQEIASQQFREPTPKDVKSQVPPSSMGQGSESGHRVQVTIAGPPQPVSSAAVHVGIVQGQAQTLTQRETSPQGQVIEKVPNPMALGLSQGPPSQPSPHPAQPPSHQQVEPRMAVAQSPRRQPSPQQVPVSRELQGPKAQQLSPHIVPPHPQSHPQSHPSYPQPQVPPYASLPPQHHLPHPQQQPGSVGSASQQASELRAVLNQPSKLVQQQQRLQQASSQQQSKQMSVHQQAQSQANLCSPNPQRVEHKGTISGQHHMPHMVVEPRGQQVNRVEAKVSQPQTGPSHIQPNTSSTYASQMDLRSGHTDAHRFPVSAHPDPRMPVAQQLYANELAIHGQAMWATGGVPRVPVDPRVMLSAPGHHPDYLAAAASGHLLSGMVPQHLQQFMHQTGAQLDRHQTQEVSRPPSARPPSRLTPPSQPSPRNTPTSHPMPPSAHHPPSSLPSQSTTDMNRMGQDFHSQHGHIQGLMRIQQRYPVMWQGQLALKNDTSQVQMHFIAGSQQLARVALPPLGPDGSCAALRIMQRMRLEPQQLDGVARRMQNDEEYTMLIAVPCGHDAIDLMTQQRTLGTWFIQYLREKQAAGIVNMPGSIPGQTAYVIHIFPPCDFASQNLARVAPEFVGNIGDIPFLLIVIATC